MYTKDDVIKLLSNKNDGELVTIEFSNDVDMVKKHRITKRANPYINRNVKKYHKMKCITTYDYEEELKKRCAKNWKVFEGLKWETWWKHINDNPHIIHYINEGGEENYYLQVVPVELVEYYYLLDGKVIDEKELEPYLSLKNENSVVKRIKLQDIGSIN